MAAGLLGLFLLGAAALAVGLAFSALAGTPVVAALLSLLVLLGLWMAGLFTVGSGGAARNLAAGLSASEHLAPFLQGRIALPDVLYYLSLCALGLFVAERVRRGSPMGLTVKRSLVASILVAAGLVLLASAVVTLLLGDARLLAGKVGLGLAAVAAGAALSGREGLTRALRGRGPTSPP